MVFPQALVTRFFQLMNNRQLAQAQRELQRLKAEMQETEWNHGYYRALYGMLLARKANGNQYTFLSSIDPGDRAALEQHRNDFLRRVEGRFQDDYDRGFFSAWSDYARLVINTIEETTPRTDPQAQMSIIQYAEST